MAPQKKKKPTEQKKSRPATKKAQKPVPKKGKQVSSPPVKSQPKVSYTSQVKAIDAKYTEEGGVPKRLDRALLGIRKDIRSAMAPIYALHSKINKAPSKHYAAKYRKELRMYEDFLAPYMADLKERREDYKTLQKAQVAIRDQRKTAKRELQKAERKLKKADEAKDYATLEKLTYQVVKLRGMIDNMSEALGEKIDHVDVEDYEPDEEEDERGFLEDPNNPYTIWEAIKQLEKDQQSGEWLYFIIDGVRYSSKNIISIAVAASEFWLSLKQRKSDTPRVNRYFNLTTQTVKYKSFKS